MLHSPGEGQLPQIAAPAPALRPAGHGLLGSHGLLSGHPQAQVRPWSGRPSEVLHSRCSPTPHLREGVWECARAALGHIWENGVVGQTGSPVARHEQQNVPAPRRAWRRSARAGLQGPEGRWGPGPQPARLGLQRLPVRALGSTVGRWGQPRPGSRGVCGRAGPDGTCRPPSSPGRSVLALRSPRSPCAFRAGQDGRTKRAACQRSPV